MSRLRQRLADARARAEASGLRRQCPPVETPPPSARGPRYRLGGHTVLGFCGNDYLGLAADAPPVHGRPGATASRLVCGEHPALRALESDLASRVGLPDAVVFPSGYQLNVGCLPALLTRDDDVFSDRLAHASLIDGLRLSSARPVIVDHNQPPPPRADAWWITESVFSMDGDGPDLDDLRRHLAAGGHVYLDEAHAFGLGTKGLGRASEAGLAPTATVITFGKAVGASGAAFLGERDVCEHIRTTARSLVYSTAPSPLFCHALAAQLDRLFAPEGDDRRGRLWQNVELFRAALGLAPARVPIVPIVVGDAHTATAASARLLERGFHVQAIRPPTVPAGAARLRVTITASHGEDDLRALATALHEIVGPRLATAS